MWTAPLCDSSQRSLYWQSLLGAGAVHHINRVIFGLGCGILDFRYPPKPDID
jgi:hypothetical protein